MSTHLSSSQIFNPPLLGIAAGIAIGMSPLAAPLFCPAPVAKAAAARLPIELNTCLGTSPAPYFLLVRQKSPAPQAKRSQGLTPQESLFSVVYNLMVLAVF